MNKGFVLLGFTALTLLNTLAHIAFKLTATASLPAAYEWQWLIRVLSQPWVYVAILCYLGTFFTWMTLLRSAPLGSAFAATHLELVGVLAASALLFGDRISTIQWLGVALILIGVGCLAVGERGDGRSRV
jgi:drug/metabolite transporter (DMT)-like permease